MAISQNFPNTRPSLNLNFARSKTLDPRITFSRTNPTATYVDDNGLIVAAGADEPRFDHDPTTGESLGLLVEEQRTNLIIDSEDINQTVGYWNQRSYTDTTYDSSAVLPGISTTGSTTGCYYLGGSSNTATGVGYDFAFRTGNIGIQTNTTYNFTIYAKPRSANASQFQTRILDYTGTSVAQTHNLSSGWERYTTEITTSSTAANVICMVGLVTATDEVFLWGAQLEAGSFPTSYIPTSGSQKTRSPDSVSMTGTNFSDWYNQSEGTILASHKTVLETEPGYARIWSINDGTSNNAYAIYYPNGSKIDGFKKVSGTSNYIGGPLSTGNHNVINKTAFSYDGSAGATTTNGANPATYSVSGNLTLSRLNIGAREFNDPTSSIHISQLTYYPTRLSNTVLQSLTK